MGARQPNGRRTMSGRSPMFGKSSGPGIASSLGEKLLRSLRSKVNSITAGTGTPSIRWIGDLNFGGHPPFLSTQLSPRGIIRPSRAAEPVQARETGALLDQRRRRNRKEEGDADWRFGAPRWGGRGEAGAGAHRTDVTKMLAIIGAIKAAKVCRARSLRITERSFGLPPRSGPPPFYITTGHHSSHAAPLGHLGAKVMLRLIVAEPRIEARLSP